MARPPEVATIRSSMRMVEQAVMGLRERYGDTRAVRKLSADVRRIFEDLDELMVLHGAEPAPRQRDAGRY